MLTATLLCAGLALVDDALGLQTGTGAAEDGLLISLLTLTLFIPAVAVTSRRLHDTGRSGWTQLLILIPVIGWFTLLVWLAEDSARAGNKWGEDPKAPLRSHAAFTPNG
ncbi:DUF805 domain-containing protein [Deinococcus radiotolerans]|uniref:DUF805 domain-containing protein n=1 Tax=Deinococcus radiotolerans TaxID=1309407 RepID=A0ABQ2FJX0_9DEIO|nr:DUF805 domain-containing protein [Deinococcus radiotolerans]GGL05309.1 hypothetical protein GCM10010844_25090 [Deinococcus radiotolerans]